MQKARVFVTRKIPEPGLELLRKEGLEVKVNPHDRPLKKEEIIAGAAGADALISLLTDEIDAEIINALPWLKIHVPLNESTRHLIGEKELKAMKKSAYLINTARGKVVDENALVEALQNGEIAGAGLDVYENEPVVAFVYLSSLSCIFEGACGGFCVDRDR